MADEEDNGCEGCGHITCICEESTEEYEREYLTERKDMNTRRHRKIVHRLFVMVGASSIPAVAGWWKDFCERHLIAEDPYQYLDLSVDQLVDTYHRLKNQGIESRAIVDTIRWRAKQTTSDEDREILTKTIAEEEK